MAEDERPIMHPDFPRWFREVSVDGAGKELRWAGIVEAVEDCNLATIEVLVRLAFRTKAPAGGRNEQDLAERLERFHQAFRNHDDTYDAHTAREGQVLAASALAYLSETSALTGLAIGAASIGGLRAVDLPMDLSGIAENALRRFGSQRRRRPGPADLRYEAVPVNYTADANALAPNNPATFATALDTLKTASDKASKATAIRASRVMDRLAHYVMAADEELQMLWWTVGDRSIDLDVPFGRVPVAAQPLVFARELADLTVRVPGPPAVDALLARAGLKPRSQLAVSAAIAAVSEDWIGMVLEDFVPSPVTTPIHEALRRRQETGSGEAWLAGWAASTGLPSTSGLTPMAVARQFYRERLLLLFGK